MQAVADIGTDDRLAEHSDEVLPDVTPAKLRTPMAALCVLVVLLLLRPWDYLTALQALRPVTLSIVGLALLSVGCGVRPQFLRLPLAKWLLGLWLVMLLTTPFSTWVGQSAEQAIKYGQQLVLFAAIGSLVVATDGLYRIASVLSASGAILALLAIRAYATGQFGVDDRITGIGEGLTSDPNDLAHTLVTLTPIAYWLFFFAERKVMRLVGLGSLVLLCAGVVATQSRGGVLALGVAVLTLVLLSRKNVLPQLAFLAVAGGIGVALMPNDATERYATITNVQQDESAMSRLAVWQAGGRMFIDHLATGVGMGQFPTIYGREYIDRAGAGNVWRAAHNSIVQVSAELGLLGAICWIGLVLGAARCLWTSRKCLLEDANEHEETAQLLAWNSALLASWAGFVCGAMFLSRAYDLTLLLLMAIISATTAITWQWIEASQPDPS